MRAYTLAVYWIDDVTKGQIGRTIAWSSDPKEIEDLQMAYYVTHTELVAANARYKTAAQEEIKRIVKLTEDVQERLNLIKKWKEVNTAPDVPIFDDIDASIMSRVECSVWEIICDQETLDRLKSEVYENGYSTKTQKNFVNKSYSCQWSPPDAV